jgi:hypothetical protein
MVCIDYQKAFDRVPHSWIIKSLELIGITSNNKVILFTKKVMSYWRMRMRLHAENNTVYEEHTTKTKISHLLYMNDLKLIDKSEEELQKQIQIIKTVSDAIHMEF